jgi:beta-N-acetylhexosaminidase
VRAGAPPPRAAVVGIAGPALSGAEAELLAAHPPAGVILFRRNCVDRGQLRALTGSLRALFPGRALPLFVDQEGGRVARLAPPGWELLPSAGAIGRLASSDPDAGREAARLLGRVIAHDLREVGIDVACAPVLDVAGADTTAAIGDRSFGADPALVAELAAAFLDGLAAGGVAGVVKHLPGHGRATVDSHVTLPRVTAARADLEAADLVPFRRLRDAPFAMTAHVVYAELDPEHPATVSRRVIAGTIRGALGVQGLLLSDDLAMGALSGSPAERALAALEAGCDLALYCPGGLKETEAMLEAAPPLAPSLQARLEGVLTSLAAQAPEPFDRPRAMARLKELLAGAVA